MKPCSGLVRVPRSPIGAYQTRTRLQSPASLTSTTRTLRSICPRRPWIGDQLAWLMRSEEHTSELQSLMRISYAVFCLKKKNHNNNNHYVLDTFTQTIEQHISKTKCAQITH